MKYFVWIAENRGKNKNGFELVIVRSKPKKNKKVWTRKITRKNVEELKEINVEIEEG